ncbi:MAG: hypothetical protein MJ175_13020, partial [Clostridia bacterium]|nr:hypothetical protein [Clostridia bacterium]
DPDADGFVHTEHTDGCLRVLSAKGFDVRWITREEQKDRFKAQDYYACNYTLQPGEKISLEFAFSAPTMTAVPASYEMALSRMTAYWSAMQAKITKLPDTDNERIINMFRQNVTQCLQMLAHYEGSDDLLCRQGDVGRYVWVYEAAHVMGALDRVGFSDITDPAYRTFTKWVSMEGDDKGKITYKLVVWDNAEGALIWGLGEHLKYSKNKEQLEYYRPYLHALLDFIHNRRTLDKTEPFTGLYPAGRASDWGEIGRHWTFTDAFMAHGIGSLVEALEAMNDADAPAVRAEYEDYCAAIIRTRDYLYQGHENDESFILPHIAGLSFEESYNHCFYTDGAPYLPQLGFMSGKSRMFEQMENFYRENGLFEHGLAGRLTNATDFGVGAYGDCYYTGISEFFWIYPWMERGEWDKVEETVKALFDYNVTPEFIVSERYCSIDPWYTPWQPNGSGSGRIITLLLDYCAAKKDAGRA